MEEGTESWKQGAGYREMVTGSGTVTRNKDQDNTQEQIQEPGSGLED